MKTLQLTDGLDRRRFLQLGVRSALLTLAASALPRELFAVATPPPSTIRFYETPAGGGAPATQWIFVNGAFTWSQAMKLQTSVAITDPYGSGWLLAPMLTPADFSNAAGVTKKAMGDKRKARGPFIGVFQTPGSEEPADGFVNLDGSAPFLTWGKYDPNDGARIHRNILREQAFHDALKQSAQLVIDYYFGAGTSTSLNSVIDFVIGEISRPEGKKKKDDVVALWHEGDGTMTAADVHFQSFYPVLLSRRKPVQAPSTGPLPTWPKVNRHVSLSDGMTLSRQSKLSWRWTGGARTGQVQILDLASGKTVINRASAATPAQPLTQLRPSSYLFRVRNISRHQDPWLEIGFQTA